MRRNAHYQYNPVSLPDKEIRSVKSVSTTIRKAAAGTTACSAAAGGSQGAGGDGEGEGREGHHCGRERDVVNEGGSNRRDPKDEEESHCEPGLLADGLDKVAGVFANPIDKPQLTQCLCSGRRHDRDSSTSTSNIKA